MANLVARIKWIFTTLQRECPDKRVVIVCHGEVMWAFRQRLERMPVSRWQKLDRSKNPLDRIHNCQIIHYTRRNPDTGELANHLDWMRSVCPWDGLLSRNQWEVIIRPRFSNEDLLKAVAEFPQLEPHH